MQPKEQKTAKELADMVKGRLGREVMLNVYKHPAYGWHVTVYATSPDAKVQLQARAEDIAKELRPLYDLKE